ncbi:hypothetical protein PFISCL1PPCAC_8796 [Pristionchus fissidentatus]|uniref:G protein-coupled receptor n=1 Tax=Pristionchus fissidentatus TaxID=1538716 RepID=A0AAV5VI54_9BILA|nr:hypothetical protein PFISCL1PPCAC_8796 [Pristionchus fissidentatus]
MGTCEKRYDTDSPLCVRLMASARIMEMSMHWILGHFFMFSSCGIVFVTTTASNAELLRRVSAGPLQMPWTQKAYTFSAPASTSLKAARQMVPHVSAMSSTRIATFPSTFPTSVIFSTSLARLRSLWMRAKSTLRRSAIDVTLLAPPASGDTITARCQLGMLSFMYLRMAGSAYKLSTGMSKKPWICDACRSIVMMWSAPATDSMLATSLAEMGARDLSFLSWRAYGKHGITAATLHELAILHALIIISSSMRLSLISPAADWMMYTSSPRTDSPISTFVSLLENFFRLALLTSSCRRSQMRCVRAGCEEPEKTLMLGILTGP